MAWKEDKREFASLWNSATFKVVRAMGKDDLNAAISLFQYEFSGLLKAPSIVEDDAESMFIAWLVPSFMVENMPLVQWYLKHHPRELTKDEEEVLLEGCKSKFGYFRVEAQAEDRVTLIDTRNRRYDLETIELPKLDLHSTLIARINSRGNGPYFFSGKFMVQDYDGRCFEGLARAAKFQDSWSGYLVSFEKYLISKEGLKERTAGQHESNLELFMMYLEGTLAGSFEEVTKSMLKSEFKAFTRSNILQKVDLDKVYYSLYKFFSYLSEERNIQNSDVLDWLRARV